MLITDASITVPADYLADLRAAFVAEVADASHALSANTVNEVTPEDLTWPVRLLDEDLALLKELAGAVGETRVEGPDEALWHALERMCKIVTDRLVDELRYSPLDMLRVLDLAARLRWAASEATRIDPHPDLERAGQEGGER